MKIAVRSFLISAAMLTTVGAAFAQPSASDRESFRMGYGIQSAMTAGRQFTENVKRLSVVSDADEAKSESDLAEQSAGLRKYELASLKMARVAASGMSIPDDVRIWFAVNASDLGKPAKPSSDASSSDSEDVKTVLAALDETSQMASATKDVLPSILASIKLQNGNSGLWSFRAGRVMADMAAAKSPEDLPDTSLTRELIKTMPKDYDQEVKDRLLALDSSKTPAISQGGGNLSTLLPGSISRFGPANKAITYFFKTYRSTDLSALKPQGPKLSQTTQ